MKPLSAPFIVLILTTSAFAMNRTYTPATSCAAVAGLVKTQGAVVLDTGPNTFDRYVRQTSMCSRDEYTVPAWVQTSNDPHCFVGYQCAPRIGER
ncbi:hypothetical protein [Methylovirgula sp. 4M-Z18]|uniref:hypothetical protein n=1 Tax=Methylovirgula sp. 4M-Z18 TaxID=2293567 RepID=UPI001314179F|nr:hypothetical protein [Methylovirgula sp. 4M-Z18]